MSLRNSESLRMKWRSNMERVSRLFDQGGKYLSTEFIHFLKR